MRYPSWMILLCLVLPGCASSADSAYPSDASRPRAGVRQGELPADIDSLEVILPLTFDALHYGTVRVVNETSALHAAALTEDDRPVELRAQQTADGLDLQVKIGYFGDAAAEQRLLDELRVQLQKFRERQERKSFKPAA